MKPITLLLFVLLISGASLSQQQIKGSSTLSQTGGPSFLTYDWSAQVSYVKTNNQVYVKISNWNIMVSPNSMYQYGGKQYSRTELGFSQWPCQDNSSGTTQITLTINASGKTFKVSISNDEGLLANSDELTNLNFNMYKVTGTSDFWVNGKGCREVEERILANQNQTKKENNSSTSSNAENSNGNSSYSSNTGNANISNSSASSAVNVPQLMSAEENMRELGIDPNTDYLGNTISMGYSFISDILDERRRKKMQYELEAERARQKMLKIIEIHKESAVLGNIESILILGSAYFYLGENSEARKWYLKAIEKGSALGYTGMARIEKSELASNLSALDKQMKLQKELEWLEKGAEAGDEMAFKTLVMYYLGLLEGYNDDLYSVNIQSTQDPAYNNLTHTYSVIQPIQPWKSLKDLDKAYFWAEKSAQKELYTPVKIASNYSQYNNNRTFKIYKKSINLQKQGLNAEAFELLKICAKNMYAPGITNLGVAYYNGTGTPVNIELARYYTELATLLGDQQASKNLPIMFTACIKEKIKNKDFIGAELDCSKMIEKHNSYFEFYSLRGDLRTNYLNDFSGAISDYTTLITIGPEKSLYHKARANVYIQLNKIDSALIDLTAAIAINPNDINNYYERAKIYIYKLNELNNALNDLNKAIEINPESSRDYYNRARVYTRLNKYTEAAKDYRKYLEEYPDDPSWNFQIGQLYYIYLNDTANAFPYLRKVLTKDSTSVKSAMSELYLGNKEIAFVKIDEAIKTEMDPEKKNSLLFYKSKMLAISKQETKALQLLEEVLKNGYKLSPNEAHYIDDFFYIRNKPGFIALVKKYFKP